MASAAEILTIVDRAAEGFILPMLDNGYVYPAAARLSLYRSPADWAMVIELFGYSPRAGVPDLCVTTIGSTVLHDRSGHDDATFAASVSASPNATSHFFHPLDQGDWYDPDDEETVDRHATRYRLRDRDLPMPALDRYAAAGVENEDAPAIRVYEWMRVVAYDHRDLVLATPAERTVALPEGLDRLLTLDDWYHPDLAAYGRPSGSDSFRQFAEVLATGDPRLYQAGRGNTHWSNWPNGGTM